MAKEITLKNADGSITYYPKTVTSLIRDNQTERPLDEILIDLERKQTNLQNSSKFISSSLDKLEQKHKEKLDTLEREQEEQERTIDDIQQLQEDLQNFSTDNGFDEFLQLARVTKSIIKGGNLPVNLAERNIYDTPILLDKTVNIVDKFLSKEKLYRITTATNTYNDGKTLRLGTSTKNKDLLEKLKGLRGKKVRLEFYVYSKVEVFLSDFGFYTNNYSVIATSTESTHTARVESTSSAKVKKYILESVVSREIIDATELVLLANIAVIEKRYNLYDIGITGLALGEATEKILLGDWVTNELESKLPVNKKELSEVLERQKEATKYNNIEQNRNKLALFLDNYTERTLDEYNRLVVSFNGTEILGSQFRDITNTVDFYTKTSPPNLEKKSIARLFYDRYKFKGEDTQHRPIYNRDWVKTGFNHTVAAPNNFNTVKCLGTNEKAEITLPIGTKYYKLVWSEFDDTDFSFKVYEKRGTEEPILVDTVTNTSGQKLIQAYKNYKVTNTTIETKVMIVPENNPNNLKFWGIEYWSKPRLDVVVGAVSGASSNDNYLYRKSSFYSDYHKPKLIVLDLGGMNEPKLYDEWKQNLQQLLEWVKGLYIPLLVFGTNTLTNDLYTESSIQLAKLMGIAVVEMNKKPLGTIEQEELLNKRDTTYQSLTDIGQNFYFEELQRIIG